MGLSRRHLLAASVLPLLSGPAMGKKPIVRRNGLAWQPTTKCGVNIEYGDFWARKVDPRQWAASSAVGISFVRAMYFCFEQGRFRPDQLDAAIHSVRSVRVDAAHPAELVLLCDGFTYPITPGEAVVLSTDLLVGSVTIPARTKLAVTSARPATFGSGGDLQTLGEVHVNSGGAALQPGETLVQGVDLLHANFFRNGKERPRRPIEQYADQASAWMAEGFGFIHGGYHNAWQRLRETYGVSVDAMRDSEWAFFAGRDWDPARVLITDENEPVWPGANTSGRWEGFRDYFRGTLYPRMRAAFPHHTLGFGFPYYCGSQGVDSMDWWPADCNTVLRVHNYLRGSDGGVLDTDGESRAELDAVMRRLAKQQRRLGIRQLVWEEFGVPQGVPDRNAKLRNFRQAIQAQGWLCAVWGASQVDKLSCMALVDGVWTPLADATGAFGQTAQD